MGMAGDDAGFGDSPVVTGGSIPGSDFPAFSFIQPAGCPIPVIIAAPHGGREYPESLTEKMRQPEWTALRLEDRYIDLLAADTAAQAGAAFLSAHAPRAMLDLNRASDDLDWQMIEGCTDQGARHSVANRRARSGLGLVPRRLSGLGEIWKGPIPRSELDARIESIHRPYHRMLAQTLEDIRDRWGAALLLDFHSMPPLKRRHLGDRPAEIVLGDRFGSTCDAMLLSAAFRYLGHVGRPAAHNRPYAGGYVLDRHAAPTRGIHALQVEVCRSLYLDSKFEQPTARMGALAKQLAGLVRELARDVADLGMDRRPPLAAE